MSSNNVMINEIRVALERDPRLPHPAEVAVDERAGTATLRGTVGSIRQLQAAIEVARSGPGAASYIPPPTRSSEARR